MLKKLRSHSDWKQLFKMEPNFSLGDSPH